MDDSSVNVESRTSSQDKRWTIMAALLGTNTAVMLFQGIEQESNPNFVREVALTIIAATIPFQGIYFLIYTFLMEHDGDLNDEMFDRLKMASALCQVVAYISLSGLIALWYSMSEMVGIAFTLSALIAMALVRISMHQATSTENELTE
ncbi:MAG: hypothetical protein HOE76_02780 [Euryarchaeota archaeon]|nr:hypothetical protein [Euryarchaeota archaeon]MBT4981639.1 hypothetical protein [Euryarchaeota archaeon]MBT5183905.1 hypothetical protein [Euryarchaeota archaeon]